MANRPYITAAQVRRSVLRRRAVKARLAAEAEAERTRRTKRGGPEPEKLSSTTSQEG